MALATHCSKQIQEMRPKLFTMNHPLLKMKLRFLALLFLLIISGAQPISTTDFNTNFTSQGRSLIIQSKSGSLYQYGNGSLEDSSSSIRVNRKVVVVESKIEHKHELLVTIRKGGGGSGGGSGGGRGGGSGGGSGGGRGGTGGGSGGGRGGRGGGSGGGKGGESGGRRGGAGAGRKRGMVGGAVIGGAGASMDSRPHTLYNSAPSLFSPPHWVSTLYLSLALITLFPFH